MKTLIICRNQILHLRQRNKYTKTFENGTIDTLNNNDHRDLNYTIYHFYYNQVTWKILLLKPLALLWHMLLKIAV